MCMYVVGVAPVRAVRFNWLPAVAVHTESLGKGCVVCPASHFLVIVVVGSSYL